MLADTITTPQAENFPVHSSNGADNWLLQAGFNADQLKLQHLAREVKEISSLYNMAVAAGSSLNLDEIVWAIYKESGQLLDTANFAIAIYETQTDILNFALVFDQGRRAKARFIKRSSSHSLIRQVLENQSPVVINDMFKINPLARMNHTQPDRWRIRSWLAVPILNPVWPDEGAQGVLVTWSNEPDAFSNRELYLLSAIGTQAAIAIRNVRLYENVLAERDEVVESEEQARRALARDLHDGPTQLVSAALMHLDFCKLLLKHQPERLDEELTKAQELARQAVDEIRTLLFELRPIVLETEGLIEALRVFLKRRQRDVGEATQLILKINTPDQSGEISRQDDKVEAAFFTIIQETVNNALKHAQAGKIVVELAETLTEIYAIISDDGNGFDVTEAIHRSAQQGSFGMVNLRERTELIGAELKLQSAPGEGTRVIVRVPKSREERLKKRGTTGSLQLRRER